jgi:hypothetical protein
MTIIKDIHKYLKDKGFNIFRSKAPLKIEDVLWIVESPSSPPSSSLGYYEQNLDLWARFRVTDNARTQLEEVQKLIHRKVAYNTDNFHVYLSVANGLVTDMGEDVEGRALFTLPLRFIYRAIKK